MDLISTLRIPEGLQSWQQPVSFSSCWRLARKQRFHLGKYSQCFLFLYSPGNYFVFRCKISLSNKSRKEWRDDPAITRSAEALVFPGTGVKLDQPQPWHLPTSPAQCSQAATASLLQPRPDNLWLFLLSGVSPAEKWGGQTMSPESDTSQGSGKTFLFPTYLTGVSICPSFSSHKISLARVLHICVLVAVVKTMPFLENIRFN